MNVGITGPILHILVSYLKDRQQFVSLKGTSSPIALLEAGVPQGSVLGPLLFLVYINDIGDNLTSDNYLFADNTSLYCPVTKGNMRQAEYLVNADLDRISNWAKAWRITINQKKTVVMLFSRKRQPPRLHDIKLDGESIQIVNSHKHLGLVLTPSLNWSEHIDMLTSRCNKRLSMLKKYKYRWSTQYWLEVIVDIGWITRDKMKEEYDECSELLAIFTSIGKNK